MQGSLICFDDWPSETGNYKGPPTASRIVRSDVAERPANESVTFAVVHQNGGMQVLRNVGHGDVVNQTAPNERDLVDTPGNAIISLQPRPAGICPDRIGKNGSVVKPTSRHQSPIVQIRRIWQRGRDVSKKRHAVASQAEANWVTR